MASGDINIKHVLNYSSVCHDIFALTTSKYHEKPICHRKDMFNVFCICFIDRQMLLNKLFHFLY